MVATVFFLLVNFSRSSPLHKNSDHTEAKESHFNRTMAAKAKLLNKVESSLNTTITKLSEVKEKMTKVTGKVKAKVMEALNKEVEKWAAVELQKKTSEEEDHLFQHPQGNYDERKGEDRSPRENRH